MHVQYQCLQRRHHGHHALDSAATSPPATRRHRGHASCTTSVSGVSPVSLRDEMGEITGEVGNSDISKVPTLLPSSPSSSPAARFDYPACPPASCAGNDEARWLLSVEDAQGWSDESVDRLLRRPCYWGRAASLHWDQRIEMVA